MKRDMELIRKLLIQIEEKYVDVWLDPSEVAIESYDFETIAYHCSILHDAGFVYDYKGQYANNRLHFFAVSRLTWEGHEFLDKIRSDTVWNRTKSIMVKEGLPFAIDVIKEIASAVTTSMVKSALQLT